MTHHSTRWTALLALALGSLTVSARASAQIAVVSRASIDDAVQITFGQLCEDRFVIRNDGAKPVDLEYAVEKGTEHTKLTLNARELVELESNAKEPLELWIGGKLVAKAEKEIAGLAGRLANPNFAGKAPPEVVAECQANLAEAEAQAELAQAVGDEVATVVALGLEAYCGH